MVTRLADLLTLVYALTLITVLMSSLLFSSVRSL